MSREDRNDTLVSVRARLKQLLQPCDRYRRGRLNKEPAQTGVVTTMTSDVPPLAPDETSAAEKVVRHISRLNASGRVSYATEAGHFQNAGIPGVIFGPGSIEQAHLPDEFIAIDQIKACSEFMTKLADWAELESA